MHASYSPNNFFFKRKIISNTDLPRPILLNISNLLKHRKKKKVDINYIAFIKHLSNVANKLGETVLLKYLHKIAQIAFRNYLSSASLSTYLKHYRFFEVKWSYME